MRGSATVLSALAVDGVVAVKEGIDVLSGQGHGLSERLGEVHGPGDVLAHHRRLDGIPCGAADREDAVVSHQHRRRSVLGQQLDDPAADLVVPDPGERPDRDLARRTRPPSR